MRNIKITDLVKNLVESDKDQYDFGDITDLSNALNRQLNVGEIDSNVGDAIDSYIRFFNRQDEQDGIEVKRQLSVSHKFKIECRITLLP